MNTKGYLPAPVFCETPTQSVSNQDAIFDGCYGVRQDTQHSSGVGFSEIGAFDGFAFSGPNLNYNSETSFEKPHQNQSEPLILSIEHKSLLYYVNYKSSKVRGQKFLFFLHSSFCCSSCTCVCQLASQLIGHFDYCHSSDCLLCGPVWNVINSSVGNRVNSRRNPYKHEPREAPGGDLKKEKGFFRVARPDCSDGW